MATIRNRPNTTTASSSSAPEGELRSSNNNSNAKAAVEKEKSDVMIYIVFLSLLFDLLAFTIILPLLPSLLEYYRVNDSSGLYAWLTMRVRWFQQLLGAPDRYLSVLFGGFLGSMFSFLQFLASPIVGSLSDYYGRKPILLLCTVSIYSQSYIYPYETFLAFSQVLRFHISSGPAPVISPCLCLPAWWAASVKATYRSV